MPTRTLTAAAARQELYDVIRSDHSFEEKAAEALALGVSYLGVDNGHLTRIDRTNGHWEAVVSTDAVDGAFPPGLELDLSRTYCRRTIESDTPIALHDAPAQDWADDPAFETHALHCYHGTRILLEGEPYGTVCFVSADPRTDPFTDAETTFVELLTRLLERELEREVHEAQLTRQANLATVLNRVLRHNIRNDMGVIRGYTQLMADRMADRDEEHTWAVDSRTALEHIDKLIDLSEKARELDQVVAAEFDPVETDIVALLEQLIESISDAYPDATIRLEDVSGTADGVTATVLASFERALRELIENGAKHGGPAPTVTVTVDVVPNELEIRIADDGPGISEQEVDVLESGSETPLTHGSGLGLWLAHWIVTSHDGSISATSTSTGTTMTVVVPRNPATDVQSRLSELTRSRDQYQAAFEEASDAMVLIDDNARVVDANPAAGDLYGLDERELVGQPIPRFLPADLDFEAAWTVFQQRGAMRDTVTVIGADGVSREVEYTAQTDVVPGQHLIIGRPLTA